MWGALRNRRLSGYKFVRQEPIGPYFADFVCREQKLVVEIDGATHSSNEEVAYESRRDAWFAANGYRVLRVTNEDVYRHLDGVCETIFAWVEGRE